jgi:hypothetical protein
MNGPCVVEKTFCDVVELIAADERAAHHGEAPAAAAAGKAG